MWSMQLPTSGYNSEMVMPLCPNGLALNGDAISLPLLLRPVFTIVLGTGLPWYWASMGLGSKVSTCEGPPFMNKKMTRLARAAKFDAFGANGFGRHHRYPDFWPNAPQSPWRSVS